MKHVCISLAAALALAVPSFAQSAEETPFAEMVVTYKNAVESTARYTTPAELSAAIDATTFSKDLTITLLRDYTVNAPFVIKNSTIQDVTLDLAGHTLSAAVETDDGAGNVRYFNPIETDVRLVIKDSSEKQTGIVRGRAIKNTATLTIEGGTFIECDTGTGSQSGAAIYNTKKLIINGGVFKTEYAGSSADAGGPACVRNVGDKATLTITGGTFDSVSQRTYAIISSGEVEISPADGKSVTVSGPRALAIDSGTAVINGGTFTATGWYGLYVSNDGLGEDPMVAAVTINGGTFQGKEYAVWVGSDHNNPVNSTVYINDGVFVNALNRQEVTREDAIVAQGGTYAADPTTYGVVIAPGFKLESKADGKFEIVEGPAFAIGDTLYETLGEALAALVPAEGATLAEGEVPTITLLRDTASAEQALVPHGANGIFDLNGFTYTYSAVDSFTSAINAHRGQASDPAIMLTITDSSAAQTGTIVAQGNADGCIASTNANLTITGGRFIQEGNSGYAIAGTDGLVIAPADGRTVELPSGGLNLRTGAWTAIKNEGITIAGGTFVAGNEPAYALYTGNGNGPTKLSISGGTFEGGTNGHVAYFATKTNVDITGGDFTDGDLYINAPDSTTVTVSGGDFRDDPRDYGAVLPPDYSVVGDGNSVTAQPDAGATYFAQIGAVKYTDMLVAFKALKNGDTIKLLADYVGTKRLEAKVFGVTVDLNGHTIDGGLYFHPLYSTEYCDNPNCAVIDTSDKPGTIKGKLPLEAGSGNSQNTFAVSVQEGIVLEVAEGGDASVSLKLGSGTRVLAEDRYIAWLGTANPLFKATDADNQAWIFPTFGAAVPFAADGVATLCADYSGNAELTLVGKTLTLDLGGHTYERIVSAGSSDNSIVDCTTSNTHLTIRNGTLKGNGYGVLYVPPSGKTISNLSLTMEDVTLASTFEATAGGGAGLMANGTMENVDFTLRRCKILLGAFAAEADGVQTQTVTDPNADICAIYFPPRGDSTLIIEDTIIKSPYGVQVCAGNLVVKGDTRITTTAANVASSKTGDGPIPDGAAISIVNRAGYGDDATTGSSIGTVTIEGTPTLIAQGEGATAVAAYTWKDNTQSDWDDASKHVTISGGTFSQKPDGALLDPDFVLVENQDGTFGVASAYVASIGDMKYASLQAAFDAATEGQTVTLIADVDCSGTGVKVGKTVTFDLNGHTLSLANIGTGNLNIGAGATLTLKDSSDTEQKGTGSGKIVATHDYATGYGYGIVNISAGAAFVMESGLIDTVRETPVNNGQFGVMVAGTGKATINGGHIRAGWYAIAGNGNDNVAPGTTIVVNGGILESTADYAIYHPQAGMLTIAGGTVAGAAGGLSINRGTATITGGTVTSKGTGDTGDWGDGTSGQGNAAIIVGAKYGDVALAISGDAVITAPENVPVISVPESDKAQDIAISGGTFSEKPDNAWFAEGFIPVENADGTFGVIEGSFAAEINGEKYLTLQEAIAAVPENGAEATTIMLLDDVTSAGSLTLTNGQKAILNMNGKTVTFTSGKLQLLTSASLTLTGEGSLVCQTPSAGAISIYGNETSQIDLLVDSAVTVNGHYGIALFGNGASACRNVTVTVKGTVKTSEGGSALYVNGTVNNTEGSVPQIILAEGATVEAASVGIHAAGYAKWNLAGTINADYAISIKCGDFTITGGSYTSTGNFVDPAEANSNGTEDTGAAISITTNPDYAQKTNVTITGGTFTSTNGYAFYEGIAVKDGQPIAEASTAVIAITGGTFVGNAEKGPIMIATAKDKQVITGGYFSAMPPTEFLADGVVSIKDTAAPENAPVALRQFAAQCGTTAYPTLRDAIIHNQQSDKHGQTITLLRNVTEPQVIQVGETLIANATDSNVIVNLNGKTVTFEDKGAFQITEKGALTLSGEGKVISKTADGDVVRIFGSQNDVANECVLNVGKDVTLEGEVGIAVYKGYPDETKCLGVNVTVEGTIISHSSFAAYINGSNKTTTGNVPTFSFTGTSKIQADTVAVYAAGYGKWTFAGDVTAGDDALSIKCGDITITGGTYMAKGEFNDPADANGNGTENTGAAVSITTNAGYAPKTNVTITGGTFISENGYAFYEGIAKKADGTPAAEASTAVIAIKGGDFTGNADLGADIAITTAENKQVVSGGTFSKPVALAYCAPGYIPVVGTEGKYTVDGTAVAAVANTEAPGTYKGYGTLEALIEATAKGTEVLIVKPNNLGEEIELLKTETGGNNATDGAKAYDVAETLGGTFKVKNGAIVYAYQLGIADLDVSESGISVTVRLEEDGAAVTRELAGRKVRVVSGETVLAEADAFFEEGACVLTVPKADLPAGNLELTISVAPAAEAETPAE